MGKGWSEIELNKRLSCYKDMWRFKAKKQGWGSGDGTLLRGNIRVGGFWLNQHDRIFTKDRLTKVVDNEFD